MKISQTGIDLIKKFEGCELTAYFDGGGVATIGYGDTGSVSEWDVENETTITEERAEELLREDIAWVEETINEHVIMGIKQEHFDALCSFVYNLGETNFRTSTLLRLLNQGLFQLVPEQFLRWKYDNGKIVKGLLRRRRAEAKLFEEGKIKT